MATPSVRLIRALRATALRLQSGTVRYQWGHMGMCNCGHLAQTITDLSPAEIHAYAMDRSGDWSEQVAAYCPTSGYPMDAVFDALFEAGMNPGDLRALERLDDPAVLRRLGKTHLRRNALEDAVLYMQALAELLDERLPDEAPLESRAA